jgi:mannose-6-phosphate isomerase
VSHQLAESLSPLWFAPVFRQYLWGGRRLGEVLGKPIGPAGRFAESWEVVDHGVDQSAVAWGWTRHSTPQVKEIGAEAGVVSSRSLVGTTLGQLMQDHGISVVGPKCFHEIHSKRYPENLRGRFPLLIKWLDAQQNLSLQVHPNNEQAARQSPPDLGKSEAWYVVDAVPGARVYAGLLPGVGLAECESAIEHGRLQEVLHSFTPQIGDCIYIPAGTIHAIGAGLLVAEVQQASDTTYRLHDWDRLGDDGKPRPLQVGAALAVADWTRGPVSAAVPIEQPTGDRLLSGSVATSETLVNCPYFDLERVTFEGRLGIVSNRCQVLIGLDGTCRLLPRNVEQFPSEFSNRTFQKGSSVLIPYAADPLVLQSEGLASLLIASLPN